jgi:hypothetical protein
MNTLPELISSRLALLVVDGPAHALWPALIARLALRPAPEGGTRLRVVDAGNCFAAYAIARQVRRATADLPGVLQRIQVARAFTCYQVLALLESAPAAAAPLLALDLLSTFYDENVRLAERQRLLLCCAVELKRLSRPAPVGALVSLRAGQLDTPALLKILESAADQIWRFEPERSPPPARLF